MAGVLFQQAVDKIVAADGPNGITRAKIIDALDNFGPFDANGWMGAKNPKGGFSDCMIMMTIKGGTLRAGLPRRSGHVVVRSEVPHQVTLDPLAATSNIQ